MQTSKRKQKREGSVKIKKDFNDIVEENTDFIMSIVRKFVKNPEIAKDLTQEIFIKAYLSYEYYAETGKIRAWLSVIAHNKLKNHYKLENSRNQQVQFLPLEDYTASETYEQSPENIAEQKDFTEQIIKIISTLPQRQRDAVFYSVIYNYTEKEIATMHNIPVGSVKSAKHYGLEKVRKAIIENNLTNNLSDVTGKVNNNMSKLTTQEAYALLYQYAKGHISSEDKTMVENYIKTDAEAANIAEALKELHGKLTFAGDYLMTHRNIWLGLKSGDSVCYGYMGSPISKEFCEKANAYLEANDGNTPPNEKWFDSGWNGKGAIAQYDNEGNRLEKEIYQRNEENDYSRAYIKKMKKMYYPINSVNSICYYEKSDISFDAQNIKKLDTAPNLYEASIQNWLGNNAKSGLYIMLPENAVNIRISRGNGVLECGKYKFLYVDRYVTSDEGVHAECTFNLAE